MDREEAIELIMGWLMENAPVGEIVSRIADLYGMSRAEAEKLVVEVMRSHDDLGV